MLAPILDPRLGIKEVPGRSAQAPAARRTLLAGLDGKLPAGEREGGSWMTAVAGRGACWYKVCVQYIYI